MLGEEYYTQFETWFSKCRYH